MSRERIIQAVGWLGLVWIVFLACFYLFEGDGSPVLNNILHTFGWR